MARIEFTGKVKQAAWDRSGGACEASGALYGHRPGVRCRNDLKTKGVEYDHINPVEQSQDAELSNCLAVCPDCHKWKTGKRDLPMLAKGKRQRATITKTRRASRPMAGSKASGWKKPFNGPAERRQ